jgi:tetratricopeptide (TPR) repeat protein
VTTYTESPGKGDSADLLWTVAEFFINRTPSYEDEKTFSQLLQTGYRRAASGNPPEWLNTATSSLSSYYTRSQRTAQAAQTMETCLSYIDKVESVPDKVKEPLLRQICTLQENQQEYAGALKTAEELLPIIERLHGANSAELSQWLVSLAKLDARVNKLDEANKNIEKAIVIEIKRPHRTLSYNYNSICNSIANVANDLITADKLDDADKLLRQAFKLVQRQNSADENWVRNSASTLFWKYQARREYEKQEATLEWIIKTRSEDLGEKDVRSNYYRTLLATAYLTHASDIKDQNPAQAQILYDKSTKVFGEAITSYQHIMGPKAIDLINAVTARAQSLDGIGKRDEAAALRRDFHLEANAQNPTVIPSFPLLRRVPNF